MESSRRGARASGVERSDMVEAERMNECGEYGERVA
jgi:hypothetical protein